MNPETWPRWAKALVSPTAPVILDVLLLGLFLLLALFTPFVWIRIGSWFVVGLVVATSVLQFLLARRRKQADSMINQHAAGADLH